MKTSPKAAKFINDTTWASGSTIFLVLAGAVLNILVGNLFDEKGLGLYSLLTTLYIAFSTLAAFGLPGAVTKFATQYADKSPSDKQFFSAAFLLGLCFSTVLAFVIFITSSYLAGFFNKTAMAPLLRIVAVGLPFMVLNKIILAQLRGYQQMRDMSIGESLRSLLIIVITCLFVISNRSLEATVWALVSAEICLLAFLLHSHRSLRTPDFGPIWERCRTLAAFGRQIIVSRLFIELDARLGILFIGAMLTAKDVGIFTIAFMFAQGLTILPTAFQKVTGPSITRYFFDDKTVELETFINYSMQATALILTTMAILIVILFPDLVRLLYPDNPAFLQAYPALLILVSGMLFQGITGSVGSVFVSIGRPDIVMKTSPFRLFSNLVFCFALVHPFGINGVAAGTAAAAITISTLWLVLIPRYLSIRINYPALVIIPASGLLSVFLFFCLNMLLPMPVALLLGVLFYAFIAYKFLPIGNILIHLLRSHTIRKQSELKNLE